MGYTVVIQVVPHFQTHPLAVLMEATVSRSPRGFAGAQCEAEVAGLPRLLGCDRCGGNCPDGGAETGPPAVQEIPEEVKHLGRSL